MSPTQDREVEMSLVLGRPLNDCQNAYQGQIMPRESASARRNEGKSSSNEATSQCALTLPSEPVSHKYL
jgi:hypothetical protein